ncbi:amidohydrolase [bacterium]|nr:amidohydrolase [bacterium]
MKPFRTFLPAAAAAVLTVLAGCSRPYDGPAADLVVRNAAVVTIDKDNPRAGAVAVIGETIVAVTSDKRIAGYIDPEKTKVIDAGGRLVIPGFNDAHLHFLSGGRSLMNLDFRYMTDIKKIQSMVKQRAAEAGPGVLIQGRAWDHELFPDKQWPTKEILDAVAPDNPVVLSRTDGHSVWVNSYVLNASGITRHTPDPPGGTIVRDPATGEPTGILKEAAEGLVKIPRSALTSGERQRDLNRLAFEKGFEAARRLGVTSFQHLNGNQDIIQEFKDEGRLTARVTFNLWLTDDPVRLREYDELRTQYPASDNWIRAGYLKAFIDGTLGSGTALMFEPFSDDPSTSGLPQMSYEELERQVVAADGMGFQIGIHAIGSKGNHWILNAYEKAAEVNGTRDSRHRSEHAQILTDEDIPRFGELGVIASMQPTHCITDKRFAEKRIGLERCRGAYAWQRLLESGAHVAFGTDWPVEPLDPMEGLYAAVTRKDREGEEGDGWFPDQRLSMEKAIELYTLGSAYAEFTEDRKGMLRKGYLADMVILDQNLLTVPPEKIMDTRVDITIVGGEIVYERSR